MPDDLFTPPTGGEQGTDIKADALVGEGKKFKSVDDLARGKVEADAFIERLKGELSGLRDELNSRTRLDEIVEKLSKPKAEDTNQNQNNQTGDDDSKPAALDASKIEELVTAKLQEAERRKKAADNLAFVKSELHKKFGNTYPTKLTEVADQLGMSKEDISAMAAATPQVLLRLFDGPAKTEDGFAPPRSVVNADLGDTRTGDRTKAYYDSIKKQDAARYWSVEVQNAMHKDAIRLGEKFFT